MGEENFDKKKLLKALDEALKEVSVNAADLRVDTPGGRFQVRWDEGGSATALGQLPFFAEFLDFTGLFIRWKEKCPLSTRSKSIFTPQNFSTFKLLLTNEQGYIVIAGIVHRRSDLHSSGELASALEN